MSRPDEAWRQMKFFLTPEHECGYLPREDAVTLVADPSAEMSTEVYSELIAHGFRRSGNHVYRPHCELCHGCIPVRVPVFEFLWTRRYRRVWKRNRDLSVTECPTRYTEEHFKLYHRYIRSRHAGGSMDHPTPENYMDFLTSQWMDTPFFEFRDADEATRQAMHNFGLSLGIAFQMVDDILDYEGSAETMGKNVGDDLTEGKPTLPLIQTLIKGNEGAESRRSSANANRSAGPPLPAIATMAT